MEVDMKVRKLQVCEMAMASFITRREAIMMVTGKITTCMGLVACTTLTTNWHMKVNGSLINSMAMAKSIMTSLIKFKVHLITQTSIISNKNGNFMKVH